MSLFPLNLLLAFVWAALTGSFTLANLLLGFAIGMLALWLPRRFWGESRYFRRIWLVLGLIRLFLWELLLSSLRVARDVLRPGYGFRPAVLAVPLTLTREAEITLLANLVTLTPGTLSIDVSADRRVLYIHAMNVEDAEETRRQIQTGFERRIMEALR